MSTMAMPPAQAFHRKPVPNYTRPAHQAQQHPAQYGHPHDELGHSRSTTLSSVASGYPPNGSPASMTSPYMPPGPNQMYPQGSRRTLSNGTSSTSSTGNTPPLQSTNSGFSATTAPPRRSTSSRSSQSTSSTSYVALMRKQKATVWCDRAQHEDPRILQAQRAAKMRAAMEVAGGHNHALAAGRVNAGSTGMVNGVRSKIRHHGAPKASTYNAGNLHGAGVPMRLSAMEVDDGESDDEPSAQSAKYHTRNGSGRSSLVGNHRGLNSFTNSQKGYSNGSTPPATSPGESMGDLIEEQTPVPNRYGTEGPDYFGHPGGQGNSDGSGGSTRREENFGGVGTLPQSKQRPVLDRKNSEELRRRGSVDDRTMTLGGGRLFVANPDLSD